MKKLVIVLSLMSSLCYAGGDNILSFGVGVGPTTINTNTAPSSSTTTYSKGKDPDPLTTNITAATTNPTQLYSPVGAFMYQRAIDSVVLGVEVQTNQTYTFIMGTRF